MGKGDKKTKKGKIAIGSYGNSRNRKKIKARVNKSRVAAGANRPAVEGAEAKPRVKRVRKKKAE